MYLDCGRVWQAHYKQDRRGALGEPLIFGTTVHHVIERFVVNKEQDPIKLWETAWSEAEKSPEYKVTVWDETPEEAKATGYRIFGSSDVIDTLMTVTPKVVLDVPAIERFVEWKLDDMPGVIGYIDCICDDGVPMDFKTAGKMWADGKAAKELQPLVYLAALNQLGETDHEYKFRHLVVTKAKNPRITIFESQRSQKEIDFAERVVRGVWQGIAEARFQPNPMSWRCNEECPIYLECAGEGQ
jgi:hypothetical protein